MSFQPIKKSDEVVSCKDFSPSLLGSYCTLSTECKKEGYILLPRSQNCTGIEIPSRLEFPTPSPPKKE